VISGKEYTAKVSETSRFCPVPVNGNGIFIFRNHLMSIFFSKISVGQKRLSQEDTRCGQS